MRIPMDPLILAVGRIPSRDNRIKNRNRIRGGYVEKVDRLLHRVISRNHTKNGSQ